MRDRRLPLSGRSSRRIVTCWASAPSSCSLPLSIEISTTLIVSPPLTEMILGVPLVVSRTVSSALAPPDSAVTSPRDSAMSQRFLEEQHMETPPFTGVQKVSDQDYGGQGGEYGRREDEGARAHVLNRDRERPDRGGQGRDELGRPLEERDEGRENRGERAGEDDGVGCPALGPRGEPTREPLSRLRSEQDPRQAERHRDQGDEDPSRQRLRGRTLRAEGGEHPIRESGGRRDARPSGERAGETQRSRQGLAAGSALRGVLIERAPVPGGQEPIQEGLHSLARLEATVVHRHVVSSSPSSLRSILASASRPRWMRIFTVPSGTPRVDAISSYERSSTCRRTIAARRAAGSSAIARSRTARRSTARSLSSGLGLPRSTSSHSTSSPPMRRGASIEMLPDRRRRTWSIAAL